MDRILKEQRELDAEGFHDEGPEDGGEALADEDGTESAQELARSPCVRDGGASGEEPSTEHEQQHFVLRSLNDGRVALLEHDDDGHEKDHRNDTREDRHGRKRRRRRGHVLAVDGDRLR
jgi:hypothetical protein